MLDWLSRLRGTFLSIFGIGGTSGVNIKHSSGALQVRNSDDSAYADIEPKRALIHGNNAANGVVLTVPDGMGSVVTLVLPNTVGTNGYFLGTDGTGTLDWYPGLAGADITVKVPFDESTSSPLDILTSIADNTILRRVVIEVEVAAAGGTPTIAIGTGADADLYVDEPESDLKTAGLYIVNFEEELGVSPVDIIATITPDSQTFSGNIILTYSPG